MVLSRNSRSCRKRPDLHFFVQMRVGGRDHAHIHALGLRRSDALHFAHFQHAQHLGLQIHRDVGDLVQKQRAAIGQLKAAHAIGLGVGERALDVPEQFAFENSLGQPAGVHRHHGLGAARRNREQSLRHHFLAGAGLAGDQHVRVRRSHARDHLQHRLHGLRLGNQRRNALGAQQAVLGFQAQAAADGVAQIDLRLDDGQQPLVLPGLLHEIARAAAHRFHRQAHRGPGRHHDHRQHRIDGLNARKQIQPFLPRRGVARVVQVHDHDVEIARFERRDRRPRAK